MTWRKQESFVCPSTSRLILVEGDGLSVSVEPFFVNIQLPIYWELYSTLFNVLSRSMHRELSLNFVLRLDILSAEGNCNYRS
jgi:hypothetical protein